MFFGRRIKFAVFILVSQALLIALAIAWVIHMALIARNGAVYFIEANQVILWAEIVATVIITVYAIAIFALQVQRLGERRRGEERPADAGASELAGAKGAVVNRDLSL